MKDQDIKNKLKIIAIRYVMIILIGSIAAFSSLLYKILLPLTIYPANFLLSLFFSSEVIGGTILVGNSIIELIPACIAVSAYLLLFILNMTAPMGIKKRVYSLLFSFALLLLINILRITFFSILVVNDSQLFESLHLLAWYLFSIIFVVGIWFLTIQIFKIKSLPVYDDLKFVLKSLYRKP